MKQNAVCGTTLILLSLCSLILTLNTSPVRASGTIYIRADGSIDPPDAPISTVDNVVYTFTDSISDEIVVERSNIIVDGKGYTLQGSGTGIGFSLIVVNNVTIQNTNIKNFQFGFRLFSLSNNNTVSRNTITNNTYGILLYSLSNNNTVFGNTITNNTYGIELFSSCDNNTVSGNTITDNTIGVLIDSSSNNSFSGNTITNSTFGIYLAASFDNKFYHNNFIGNTQQVYVGTPGIANFWDDGYPSGGNYWDDYAGVDADGDGVGDTPYVIDALNQDNYPPLNPLSPIVGDVNADGVVDIFDIGYISAHWYPGPPIGPLGYDVYADINNDLAVDIFDIGITSAHWGASW